ncbi:hypothetical protein PCANB_000322 [Pneumocystis canis]|nr:hypothetical protein PCK1_000318 [Pneumocystis canis]KAG5437976.1 hypothetical protein PCANB_000322 [Pneumocystis canis]
MTQRFVKLTTENKSGFWYWLRQWLAIDPNRSSGLIRNDQFRKPTPGTLDKPYARPMNLPASDIAENPYWKRDTRHNYPRPSVITQETLIKLLLRENTEPLRITESSEISLQSSTAQSLSTVLRHITPAEIQKMVLTEEGVAPLPGKSYSWSLDEQSGYPSTYPVRTFR